VIADAIRDATQEDDWISPTMAASVALTAYESHLEAEGAELLPLELPEDRIRELCGEMAVDTGKQPSAGKMRNAVRKHHAVINSQKIAQAFASSNRVFLVTVGKASMQEASAEREARSEQIPPGKEESK